MSLLSYAAAQQTDRQADAEFSDGSYEGSTSFLKKRSKKLLIPAGLGTVSARCFIDSKFFGSFFQKRTAFFLKSAR
jgi:hypothetical protein